MSNAVKQSYVKHEPDYIETARFIAEIAAAHKARNIKALDVRGLTLVADCFVFCTASSRPQLKAVFNAIREQMRERGRPHLYTEGDFNSGWIVLDYGDVLVHIFREEAWEFYDLEDLWADAPVVDLMLAE